MKCNQLTLFAQLHDEYPDSSFEIEFYDNRNWLILNWVNGPEMSYIKMLFAVYSNNFANVGFVFKEGADTANRLFVNLQ